LVVLILDFPAHRTQSSAPEFTEKPKAIPAGTKFQLLQLDFDVWNMPRQDG